jgi:hypothetical protein
MEWLVSLFASPALGLIGGAITRIITGVQSHKDKQLELDHEYRMQDKILALETTKSLHRQDEIYAQSDATVDVNQSLALIEVLKTQATPTGIKWVDALNAGIRPIMTIWWCLVLYTITKLILVYLALTSGLGLLALAGTILTTFDQTVIASILGFWFVDRNLGKAKL